MVDNEYLELLLDSEGYQELLDSYGTSDLSLIAELIIKEGRLR